MLLTSDEIDLVRMIIDNLEIYVSDDDHFEMREEMVNNAGFPNWEDDLEALQKRVAP